MRSRRLPAAAALAVRRDLEPVPVLRVVGERRAGQLAPRGDAEFPIERLPFDEAQSGASLERQAVVVARRAIPKNEPGLLLE